MIRVLLIEDNSIDAMYFSELLKSVSVTDFAVTCADTIDMAIKFLKKDSFDIILSDLNLSDSEGIDTFRTISARCTSKPIVVLTGSEAEEGGIDAVKEGAQDYLVKGQVNKGLLTRSLLYAIERKRTEEELKEHRNRLEEIVQIRTATLELANTQLHELAQQLKDANKDLRRAFEGIVNSIANVIEVRDPYTAGHEERVSLLASTIAGRLNLPDETVQGIRVTGLVHDVGKICIPSGILNKPGKLSKNEMSLIRDHVTVGYEILRKVDLPWPVAEILYQHHERLDGSGYPRGLKGNAIRLEARIIAIADVTEAMSSHRPYRPSRGMENALQEIQGNSGNYYDPEIVTVCVNLFQQEGFRFEWESSQRSI